MINMYTIYMYTIVKLQVQSYFSDLPIIDENTISKDVKDLNDVKYHISKVDYINVKLSKNIANA